MAAQAILDSLLGEMLALLEGDEEEEEQHDGSMGGELQDITEYISERDVKAWLASKGGSMLWYVHVLVRSIS